MSARFRPGSRVQQVWEKWETDGPEKATKFGLTLDLKPGTLTEWMRNFARISGQPVPAAKPRKARTPKGSAAPAKVATAKADKADKPPKPPKPTKPPKLPKRLPGPKINENNFGKRRVYCTYNPERHGTVNREGPEVSNVTWDNGDTVDQNQANERLRDVGTPYVLPKPPKPEAPRAKVKASPPLQVVKPKNVKELPVAKTTTKRTKPRKVSRTRAAKHKR